MFGNGDIAVVMPCNEEEKLCGSAPVDVDCSGDAEQVNTALVCSHYGFAFTHVCVRKVGGCKLFKCISGSTWDWKKIGNTCPDAVGTFCQ
jgi:hypothetical protein